MFRNDRVAAAWSVANVSRVDSTRRVENGARHLARRGQDRLFEGGRRLFRHPCFARCENGVPLTTAAFNGDVQGHSEPDLHAKWFNF